MSRKESIFFWLTCLALVLLVVASSIILLVYPTTNSSSLFHFPHTTSFRFTYIPMLLNGFRFISSLFPNMAATSKVKKDCHHYYSGSSPPIWNSEIIEMYDIKLVHTVDLKGCGNFTSVQKAIDAIPDNATFSTLIAVYAGTYREKVSINESKNNVILSGQGYLNTTISWHDSCNSTGKTLLTWTVGVWASNFIAKDISFRNTANPGPEIKGAQAVALGVYGDKVAFYGCGIYGHQDTLNDNNGRHYFKDCFIEGSIDFIFGNARSLYQNCEIHSVAQESTGGISGIITAQAKSAADEKTGYSFVNCTVQGYGKIWLGRSWSRYATVVFSRSFMSAIVAPDGWNDWGNSSYDSSIYFGEYENYGPGSVTTKRVGFAKQLDESEAAPFMDISYIDGESWLHPAKTSSSGGVIVKDTATLDSVTSVEDSQLVEDM